MSEGIMEVAQTALNTANKVLDLGAENALLGRENAKEIAVLGKELEGHKETCEAQNEATHQKLDFIIGFLKWGAKLFVGSGVPLIAWLLASKLGWVV